MNRLSVADQLVLEFALEAETRGRLPFRASAVIKGFQGLVRPLAIRRALMRLADNDTLIRSKTKTGAAAYTLDKERAWGLLAQEGSTLDGAVYRLIVELHPLRTYVDRADIDSHFDGTASLPALDNALHRLQEEKLLTRASFSEERYFPSHCDDALERELALLLEDFPAYVRSSQGLRFLDVFAPAAVTIRPGYRIRPSVLAERVAA